MTWHVDPVQLERWMEGTDGAAAGASVEQHLLSCERCRALIPPPATHELVWGQVRDAVELPRPSRVERALTSLGLSSSDARIIAVSPAFRSAWLVGLAVMLGFAALAGSWDTARGQAFFLLLAPLVPALGVALGYDPETEPAVESELATPWSRFRLVSLRSVALLLTSLPLVTLVWLLVPGRIALLWWIPALMLTATVLAASTWVAPFVAVGGVGAGWAVLVALSARQPSTAVDGGALVAYVVVAALAGAVLVARRHRLGTFTWDPR